MATESRSLGPNIRGLLARVPVDLWFLMGLYSIMIGAAVITTPEFATTGNLRGVLAVASLTGTVAVGMTLITMSGNFFSLALEQTAAVSVVIFGLLVVGGQSVLLTAVVCIAVCAAIGAAQGVVVSIGANPVVTTIGAGGILLGVAALLSGGLAILLPDDNSGLAFLVDAKPLGIPIQAVSFVVVTLLIWFVTRYTRLGRAIILTGANKFSAQASGIKTGVAVTAAFAIASATAAIASLFVAAQAKQAYVDIVIGLNLNAVAAVLVGGTSLKGGGGSVIRSAAGAFFIVAVQNVMGIHGYSQGVQQMVAGVVVAIGVAVYWIFERRALGV